MSKTTVTEGRLAFGIPVLHAALIAVLVLLFTWPAATAEPRGLPIGVVGPAQVTGQVSDQLESSRPGAFEIEAFESQQDAEQAITNREIYGAILIGPEVGVLIGSAANPGVAQLISELGSGIQESFLARQGVEVPKVKVTDLATLPEEDARGQVLGSASLPLVIAGISLGALVMLRIRNRWSQINLLASASLIRGLTVAFILTGVMGALEGGLWINTLVISSIIGAFGFSLVGAYRLFGLAGFGTLAAVFFLLGNPLSGVALAPEFYQDGWGSFGQALPLGAGFELIKRTNFFESADASQQWWVLGIWILVGLAMWAIGFKRKH
jgi:hypothetical protein